MNYQEVCEVLGEAWSAFEEVLWQADFNVDKFVSSLDCKDVYSAVRDAAMESKPKGGEE